MRNNYIGKKNSTYANLLSSPPLKNEIKGKRSFMYALLSLSDKSIEKVCIELVRLNEIIFEH